MPWEKSAICTLIARKVSQEVIEILDPFKTFSNHFSLNENSIEGRGVKFQIKGKLHLFGVGKAASFQVEAFLRFLKGSALKERLGICLSYTQKGYSINSSTFLQLEGDHPLVSEENLKRTETFIEHLGKVGAGDTIVFFLSGGSSALLELPKDEVSFKDLQKESEKLLESGFGISEINAKRKEFSQVKGGGLLTFIKTSNILQFVTCDIPNGRIEDVGSGPLLKGGKSDPVSLVFQSADILLDELIQKHGEFLKGQIYDCSLEEMEEDLIKVLESQDKDHFFHVSGGEAPIILKGDFGQGGRNTHFVLSFAEKIYQRKEWQDIKILSLASDGTDGNSPCAGAFIDFGLFSENEAIPFLESFNSYKYFERINALLVTGPTKTNVMDLRILWRE